MEQHLDGDFSGVPVHTDGRAAQTASMANAQTFTLGRDVLATGQFRPAGSAVSMPGMALQIQPKLPMAVVDDQLEREADVAAEHVAPATPLAARTADATQPIAGNPTGWGAPAPRRPAPGRPVLQRQCTCGGTPGPDGECSRCRAKRLAMQRAVPGDGRPLAPPLVHEVLSSPGAPLDAPTRAAMQAVLGADLGRVRVHTDERAAASAHALDALAYTVGSSIVFGRGRYEPQRPEGRALLAHELVHTIQQGDVAPPARGEPLRVDPPHSSSEREAHTASLLHGRPAMPQPAGSARTVARQAAGGAAPARAPAYGAVCAADPATRPCQQARCTNAQRRTIAGDLTRARSFMATALRAVPAGTANSLLQWHFNSTSPTTVAAILTRLRCIDGVLASAISGTEWGCDPDYGDAALAYVCVSAGNPAVCAPQTTNLCFTSSHTGQSDEERALTAIHEGGHRTGLSAGNLPDVYSFRPRFRYMNTDQALANTDSFAHFVVDVATGASLSLVTRAGGFPGAQVGAAISRGARPTWIAQLSFLDLELQHPTLDFFQPSVGFQLTIIGERITGGAAPLADRNLNTIAPEVIAGLRIGDARPGSSGGAFGQLSGSAGPAYTQTSPGSQWGFTGSVGVSFGYRWRWLEGGVGVGYRYDQTGERIGAQHLVVPHAFVNISLPGVINSF